MLGMLAGGISSVLQVGMTGLQTVFGWLTTGLRFVGAQLLGFAGLLGRVGGLLARTIVSGLLAFGNAIAASTRAAMEYSRGVINLRNSTGMSTGMAHSVTGKFGAFGIGPKELENGGQYHGVTSMRGSFWNVNPYDPASINARSRSFGSGFMGHSMRTSMLESIGQNTENGRFLANLKPEQVQQQMAFQSRMQSTMGISPETVRKLAEDLPLLLNRFEMFRQMLMNKVASVALPYLQRAFEKVSDFLAERGGQIGELVGRAVEWSMNALTRLADYLLENGPAIGQTIIGWVRQFLVGTAYMLRGVGLFTANLSAQVPAILATIDTIFNGFRAFIASVYGASQVLVHVMQNLTGGGNQGGTQGTGQGAAGTNVITGQGTTQGAAQVANQNATLSPQGVNIAIPGQGGDAPPAPPGGIPYLEIGKDIGKAFREMGEDKLGKGGLGYPGTPGNPDPFGESQLPGQGQAFIIPAVARALPALIRVGRALAPLAKGVGRAGRSIGQVGKTVGRGTVNVGRGIGRVGGVVGGVLPYAAAGAAAYYGHQGLQGAGNVYNDARDAALNNMPVSNLAGDPNLINNLQSRLGAVSNGATNAADQILAWDKNLEGMLKELMQVNKNTKDTANSTEKTASNMGGFGSNTANRVLSYIAEDTYLGIAGL